MSPRAVLYLLALPQLALAGGLKLVAEFPDLKLSNPTMVSDRYLHVGLNYVRSANGRGVTHHQLFDLRERKVVDVPIPVVDMPQQQLDLLGTKQPSLDIVHHANDVTSFITTAKRNYQPVVSYFGQYDQRSKRFSELVLLCPWEDLHHIQPLGFDPTDRYYYYAVGTYSPGAVGLRGYLSLELARVDLLTRKIENLAKIDRPTREWPLQLVDNRAFFSPDGKKVALVEYSERSIRKAHPSDPQQEVLVFDTASRQVDAYPAPLTAYGVVFTRDDRHLILGSNQLGEMVRIDLEHKRIDLREKGHVLVHDFLLTPSGHSFLVTSNTILSSPKAVEVRRVSDLKVQTSIPVRMLYPGIDGVMPEVHGGLDGRMLVTPFVDQKGWSRRQGVRLYEVADDVDTANVEGSSAGDGKTAMAIVIGKQYADSQGLLYEQTAEDPNATFAKAALTTNGDICVTGILSQNTDYDYKVGRTKPVIARIDAQGKERWKRTAEKKGFLDYEDAGVAATGDGGCVFAIYSYIHPGRHPSSRLVKVDAKGNVQWEYVSKGQGGAKHQLGDKFDLLPDGSVQIIGRWYEDPEDKVKHDWKAVIAPDGKVVSDEISP